MKMVYYGKTDTGIVRKENQDAFGVGSDKNFFVVCDGMGGGAAGDFASRCAVEVILKTFESLDQSDIRSITGKRFENIDERLLRPAASIMLANRMLNNLTLKYPKLVGMGTTVVAARFDSKESLLHIYHTGDSRIYRIRGGIIELLTKDHSKVNELIDEGKMREDEVKTAELQSMITRALGTGATVKVDYRSVIVKPGDHYIMCSDGLNGEIDDSVIKGIVDIHRGNPNAIANELIMAANNSGGRDNTTVIVLKAEDDGMGFSVPEYYVQSIITIGEDDPLQSAAEDKIFSKYGKDFGIEVPKAAKEVNIFTNPLFIACISVALVISIIFLYSKCNKKREKEFHELTGNISGINLDIRTPNDERIIQILSTSDKISRLEILKEIVQDKDSYTVPLANVQVLIEEKTKPNKFVGLSSLVPLEIKLPKGDYKITLIYPEYKILTDNYYLTASIDISLELSGSLGYKTVIMLPEKAGE
ncbi:MAG: protein phosphatase 2C domain-containing protein [Endomicrobium sp.]|jgi:protein phosphatase|nr:protein phosphatase 2C domain-containing protein [Endomicrobium sp.]